MKLSNGVTTVGGIMAAFGAIPVAIGTIANQLHLNLKMPNWLYIVCIFLGVLGPALIGIGAKGKDEHSTADQVNQSTQAKQGAPGK